MGPTDDEVVSEEARRLGEAPPQAVGDAVDNLLSAFPGSTVVEDYQQVGHDAWVDRLTGLVQPDPPRHAIPMIGG